MISQIYFRARQGAKRVSNSTEGVGVGTALGKFDSSDSSKGFDKSSQT